MRETSSKAQGSIRITRALCWVVIAFAVFRVLQITPGWVMGAPPAYPGEYQARLLGSMPIVFIMAAVLVNKGPARSSTPRQVAYWALLATAMVTTAVMLWVEVTRSAA